MKIRPITLDDSAVILEWRNDPHTRAMSRTHDPVSFEDHTKWFQKAIAGTNRLMLMGEQDGRKIGLVRFDRDGGSWETGINLNPDERGKGLGALLLRTAVLQFQALHPSQKLTAVIRPDNQASRKIFEACGFRWVDRRDEHDHFEAP